MRKENIREVHASTVISAAEAQPALCYNPRTKPLE